MWDSSKGHLADSMVIVKTRTTFPFFKFFVILVGVVALSLLIGWITLKCDRTKDKEYRTQMQDTKLKKLKVKNSSKKFLERLADGLF